MTSNDSARTPLGVLTDVTACVAFMTRLGFKVPWLDRARPIGQGAWALPFAGAFMGAVAGAAYAIATGFAFGPVLAAVLAVAAGAAVTGARGEWGLAAAAEAWAGEAADGGRLAATGATVLVLSVVLRVATIAAFDDIGVVMAALMAAGALGAAAVAGVLYYMPLPGEDRPPSHNVMVAGVLAVAITFLVLPFGAFAAVIVAVAVGAGLAVAHRRWAGETSPAALGALQLATETMALLAIAASA